MVRAFIAAHPVWIGIGAFYLFSNAVGALPTATEKSSVFYRWFYGFSHGLAGNLKYALRTALPQYVAPSQQ